MAMILTINAIPETFTSQLPDGIHGDITAIDRITPDNVQWIEEDNDDNYEGNLDAEFTVCFNNGDMMQIDGYNGLWEIKSWNRLSISARNELIDDFREWAKSVVESMND